MDLLRSKAIITLGRTSVIVTTLLILSFAIVFSQYPFFGQLMNTEATAGGELNVLYAGSLLSVMETKIGPAFRHLGYEYRGDGHGKIRI
jgi:ABC-type molybdate transport system substrate-binding protein